MNARKAKHRAVAKMLSAPYVTLHVDGDTLVKLGRMSMEAMTQFVNEALKSFLKKPSA